MLPYARAGIIGAVVLGLGRALGETMAVTMVIGNSPEIHASLFAPGYTLPASSPTSSPRPPATSTSARWPRSGSSSSAHPLLNALARLLVGRVGRGPQGARA